MNIMNEITSRRDSLYEKFKNSGSKDKNIYNEYIKLLKLIESINALIRLEIKYEDIDMKEFEELKEQVYKDDIYDPIYPYIFSVEFLRDEADEIISKELVYKYISDEIDKSNKFEIE